MGKFSAAKIFDALDQKLQKAVNYLIDLLETGYVTEGRIDNNNIRVEVSPKVGLAFYQNGVYMGGLEIVNGKLMLTTTIMKGVESKTKYIIWEDAPGTSGSPTLRLYYNDICRGEINPHNDGMTYTANANAVGDSSELWLSATNYNDEAVGISNILVQGNVAPLIRLYAIAAGLGPNAYMKTTMTTNQFKVEDRTGSLFSVMRGAFNFLSVPIYANNAAALAGGLVVGDLYRTGGDPDPVCIVH